MKDAPYKRHLDSITRAERNILEAIREPSDIKSASILNIWSDDHLPCFGVELNGVQFGWWWSDYETIAAYKYWQSSWPARVDLINHLLVELVDTGTTISPNKADYQIKIGSDGQCQCACDPYHLPCPLGRTISENRCTEQELKAHGVATVRL